MKKEKNNTNPDLENNNKPETDELREMQKEAGEPAVNSGNRIEELENEVAVLKDKLLRRAAEFENYKRRTENDQLNLLKYSAEAFIIKLLPVIDDFERSLQHIDSSKDIDAIKLGLKLIYDKLMKVLDEQGVNKIESIGHPFDVNFHEALMQRKADEVKPHTVLDEIEKGYMYKDRVIRHAKVVVSEDHERNTGDGTKNSENKEE